MGWWQDLWTRRSEDWTVAWLPSPAADAAEAEADRDYLSIVLKSARVVDVRKGSTTFFGTVHSYIRLPHRSSGMAEFNVVTTPGALRNVDAAGIDRVLQLNQRLLGPVPYVGGDLELEVGLFSVASANLAGPYLALLETLSKTAGVASVGAALPFAGAIVEGMKLLTGSDRDVALEIGLATMQPVPRLGYCAVVRAPKGTLDVGHLQIDDTDFRLLHRGRAVDDYPYMVLEFTAGPQRSDWFTIPEISAAYKRVQEEFREGRESGLEERLMMFRRIALTCNDLQDEDARRLIDKVTAQYAATGAPAAARRGTRAAGAPPAPELHDIDLYG